jgi:hypothetical protein
MTISGVITQLRTTDLESSIHTLYPGESRPGTPAT